jgi:hypothetical protein
MSIDEKRLAGAVRGVPPCKGCTERFLACHDRCPKDARGEFGYNAWKAEIERIKGVREKYLKDNFNSHHGY